MAGHTGRVLAPSDPAVADDPVAVSHPQIGPSAPLVVAALRFESGWRLVVDGQRLERLYDYQIDAEEAALLHASRYEKLGRQTEVMIHQGSGEIRRLKGPKGYIRAD